MWVESVSVQMLRRIKSLDLFQFKTFIINLSVSLEVFLNPFLHLYLNICFTYFTSIFQM